MSIVDQVCQISQKLVGEDENLEYLKEALVEYHKLVEDGLLVPRKNTIQNLYTPHAAYSNAADVH